MSHVAEIELHVKDLEALRKAAVALGMELREGQTQYKWFGTSVGDYPLPAGFTAEDLGKCEHALGIPGKPHAYEVGVVKRRDGKPGYTLLWDFWAGGHGLTEHVGNDGMKLVNMYAAQVSMKRMRSKGFRTQLLETKEGLRVKCSR